MTRVVITGLGTVSPFGVGVEALWSGLVSGRSAVRGIPRFVSAKLPVIAGGQVPLEGALGDLGRDRVMSTRSIDESLAQAGIHASDCGFIWANGLDTFAKDAGALVERSAGACFTELSARFARPRRMVGTACASATQAIGEAFQLVRRGTVRACVAGGATVMLTPHYALGFAWLQALAVHHAGDDPSRACRPFDRERSGFVLAEGGGAVVLEALEAALARGARPLAEVVGFGASQDAFDLNRPPPDGTGAELAMRRALADARLEPAALDAISAHGTGTRAGDPSEIAAIRRVAPHASVTSIKGALGHCMAGAGALQAAAAVRTIEAGLVPPTCNLVDPDDDCIADHVIGEAWRREVGAVLANSFGMGGQNASVIYARYV